MTPLPGPLCEHCNQVRSWIGTVTKGPHAGLLVYQRPELCGEVCRAPEGVHRTVLAILERSQSNEEAAEDIVQMLGNRGEWVAKPWVWVGEAAGEG